MKIGRRSVNATYLRVVFALLRWLDGADFDVIYCQIPQKKLASVSPFKDYCDDGEYVFRVCQKKYKRAVPTQRLSAISLYICHFCLISAILAYFLWYNKTF
jgi:hypothetical protein